MIHFRDIWLNTLSPGLNNTHKHIYQLGKLKCVFFKQAYCQCCSREKKQEHRSYFNRPEGFVGIETT